jgi:hypothetical protein
MAGGGDANDDDDGVVTLEELVKVRASFFLSFFLLFQFVSFFSCNELSGRRISSSSSSRTR